MKEASQEWVQKAEADWQTAWREFGVKSDPNFDAVCFHAHQCVKKYFLARLEESELPMPTTHHLGVLLTICVDAFPKWDEQRDHARVLTAHTLQIQHPGPMADRVMARLSLDSAEAMREVLKGSFED